MKRGKWWIYTILILIIVYLMGPRPSRPVYDKKLPEVPAGSRARNFYKDP